MPLSKLRAALALCTAVLFTGGCADSTGPNTGTADSLAVLPRALSTREQQAISAGNDFALRLLQRTTARETGNVLLSPLSVSLALGMTMNGAANQTLAEMQRTLGWGDTPRADINVAYRDLMTMLPALDRSVTVKVANGIWMRSPYVADTGFTGDAQRFFNAPVTSLATPRAMFDAVNAWGNRETNGMIPRVLEGEPPQDLLMLLANAVYFRGTWRDRFDVAQTRPLPFTREGRAPVNVPMMSRNGGFAGYRDQQLQAVELAYGNSAYTMLVVMPSTQSVGQLVATLDTARLQQVIRGLRPAESDAPLVLPRFSLSGSLALTDDLKAMGMPRAFTSAAQFPRLVTNTASQLGFVQHAVKVEVDEVGTRAAAVTVVGVGLVSIPLGYTFDRPFVFFIRERLSGTVLFAGVVREPLA
ncbi:serpin family protein [Gemmatimonas sp.]|uniref:serpin family protein n=1 Tax=Gemmatimonas sp. TaxID=1962908 RepID=UPI003342AA39